MTENRKIHEGVADLSETYKLLNRHSDKPYQERVAALWAGEWWETTEEAYWNFLEMMPPAFMSGGSFAMLEATIDEIRSVFYKIPSAEGDRFFHASVDLTDRAAFHEMRDAITQAISADAVPAPGMN